MDEEICVGRKEIIEYFKRKKIIKRSLGYIDAWHNILRWRKRYDLYRLFHRHPNGYPKIYKEEIDLWVKEHERLSQYPIREKTAS